MADTLSLDSSAVSFSSGGASTAPSATQTLTSAVPLKRGSLATHETIHLVEAYQHQDFQASQVFAMAGEHSMQVFHLEVRKKKKERIPKLQLNRPEPESLECLANKAIHVRTDARVDCMSFAPMSATDNILTMCVGKNNQRVGILRVSGGIKNVSGETPYQQIADMDFIHPREPITSVAFVPASLSGGSMSIVTGSEDQRCRVVDVERQIITNTFSFGSSVVSVQTHPELPSTILVAEENGLIHLHDLNAPNSRAALLKTDIFEGKPVAPLSDVHWHPTDPNNIGGVAGNRLYLWDLTAGNVPVHREMAHPEDATQFRWAANRSGVFSTANIYDTFKIWDLNSNMNVLKQQMGRVGGMTWAPFIPEFPLCCVTGADRSLNVWTLE